MKGGCSEETNANEQQTLQDADGRRKKLFILVQRELCCFEEPERTVREEYRSTEKKNAQSAPTLANRQTGACPKTCEQ